MYQLCVIIIFLPRLVLFSALPSSASRARVNEGRADVANGGQTGAEPSQMHKSSVILAPCERHGIRDSFGSSHDFDYILLPLVH